MEPIIILGKGGHARSLIDLIEEEGRYKIVGCIVNDYSGRELTDSYSVIGTDDDLEMIYKSGVKNAALGIGFLGKGAARDALWQKLKAIGYALPIVCSPSAVVSPRAEIGEGCFIGKSAVINAGAKIGVACIINTGAVVEHDCAVGSFSHISVRSVLCGGVQIGKRTFVGANATVIQEKTIGSDCIVGAGVTIRKSMGDHCMAYERKNIAFKFWGGVNRRLYAGGAAA